MSVRMQTSHPPGQRFAQLGLFVLAITIWGHTSIITGQEPQQNFQVGAARIDITPFYPVRLNGFGSRRAEAEGVSQKLWAKALAVSDGDHPPFVLLAIDSLGIREPMLEQVAVALQTRYQVPRDQIALTFTHTHCAPKVNGASDTIFSTPIPADHQLHIDRYTAELPNLLIQVASEAIENRQAATLEWQIGKVTFAANRRTPGGPVDHDLPVLMARDVHGKPFAIYTSYACHCVTLSFNFYSGDWAGYAQQAIEDAFPGTTALVSIGCGSDSNPSSGVTGDRVEAAQDQGKQIGDEIKRLFETRGRVLHGPLTARREMLSIALSELPSREQLEALVEKGGPAGYNASWQLAILDRGDSLTSALNYPVQSFTFGNDLQMVFLAGEVCVDYSHRLKKELNRDQLWINAYSNDFCAYIPSERLLVEGGYGGGGEIPYFALPTTLKAGLEQQIIDAVKKQTPEVFHLPAGTQGIPPKSPEDSLSLIQTHPELQVELVACEPLVADPVAIDFGSDGRLWVAEMPDYSRGVSESFEQHGRIRVLTDTDNDGTFDASRVFLTGLRFPTDVKVWRDGILVCDAPDVIFAADRDGDGAAEVRNVVLSGFATHNPHARVNSLRFGWDGWVYGSGGLFGGQIISGSNQAVDTANRDFRFNPDTGVIESATGQTQQGRTRDDFGNWFGCTNGSLLLHYPLDERYAARAPNVAPPETIVPVPSKAHGQRLFPPDDLVLFKLTGAPGRPTSACGAEIYRDRELGQEYYGDAFVCEPVNQLVHRLELGRDDQGRIVGNRADNELQSEFIRSSDRWFRPVQVRTGTDGALYVVDMYRYVIEHAQWIPEETKAELDLLAGQDRGRIYRVTRRGQPKPPIPRINDQSPVELAGFMQSTNGPLRDLVQQELGWRQADDPAVDSELERVAQHADWPPARLQALATLATRGKLPEAILIAALESDQPESQRALVKLGEGLLSQSQSLRDSINKLTAKSTPAVEIQLAFSSAEMPPRDRIALLAKLLQDTEIQWVEYASLTAMKPQDVAELWGRLSQTGSARTGDFYRSLIRLAAADQVANLELGRQVLAANTGFAQPQQWKLLAVWLRGSSPTGPNTASLKEQVFGQSDLAIQALLADATDDETRIAALELLSELAISPSTAMHRELSAAGLEAVKGMLTVRFSPAIQSAALQALAALSAVNECPLFLEQWSAASPNLRDEIIDLTMTRPEWTRRLLKLIADRQIMPGDLNATQREQLTTQTDPELAELAQRAFAAFATGTRTEVLQQWQPSLRLTGSVEAGRNVFAKHCAACHVLDGAGHAVGPDLAALTNRTPMAMFVAILDPNRDIDSRYLNLIALTRNGQMFSGLLAEETAVSVTLKEREGKTHVVLRQDLEDVRVGKSAMPEGIEKDFSHQDLADLITYLVPPRLPPKSFAGNEPAVVSQNGDGNLELMATQAEIYGTEIIFESNSPFKNIGYWSGEQDRAAWKLACQTSGRYDVYLDYACAADSAGNPYSMSAGNSQLSGTVESTGGWSEYRWSKVGSIDLVQGENYLTVGFGGTRQATALFDLRKIVIAPEGRPLANRDFVYVCTAAGAGGYEAFPDICRLNDGRLMCVFYAGYGHVALPNEKLPSGGRIAYCLSGDEGQTWTEPETLVDGPDDDRDPSIVQLKDGRLICNFFSLRRSDTPRGFEGLGTWIVSSDDLGKSWSAPVQISKTHYCSAPIRELSNGRLILGLYTEEDNQSQGSVIFSDDGGNTWQPEVLIDNGGIRLDAETDLIELNDGTLYAAQRPHMCFATSQDFGSSWTVSQPIGFPGHCPYFLRTQDGAIVLAFRLPNTSLRISRDECKTWSENVVIDEVRGAYPSMVNLEDGSVLVVYYEEGTGSNIRAKKFRVTAEGIEWISFLPK